jgi:hydroxyacylglutathione hydrolase
LRAKGLATLPTRLDLELATNPFLRPHVAAIRQRLGMLHDPDWRVFAEIRDRKNNA